MTRLPLSKPSRRRFIHHAGMFGAAALTGPAFAQSSNDTSSSGQKSTRGASPLDFTVYRNGSWLGHHRLAFAEEAGRLTVDIDIAFDVKLAFIPLYSYRHMNREVWEGGRLISMSTATDDNGTPFKVEVVRDGDRLLVDGVDGRQEVPGDTQTTSYWNEAALRAGVWLDTQRGQLVRSEVSEKSVETVRVEGVDVEATPYDLAGDITCTIWYREGRWVKLRFLGEDESQIEYTLEPSGQSG